MDPLMRQWLSSLKKQRTELDWQNRTFTLFEDVNADVEEVKKRYKEIHGIDPTGEQLINIASEIKKGKKPEQFFPKAKETSTQTPSAPKPEYVPQSGTADPIGMSRAMEEYRQTAKRHGVDLSPGLEKQLENIRYTRGHESAQSALQDMIGNLMKEQGTSAPKLPSKEKSKSPTAAEAGVELPKPIKSGEPITPPSTKTPEEASTKAAESLFGKLPIGKAKEAGTSTLFGAYGAASLPGDIQKIAKRSAEPSYGRSEVISSPDYKPEMTDAEIALRGEVMRARDIARTGEHGAMAGGIASMVPGASKTLKAVQKGGELATKAFAPLAVMSSGLDAVSAAQRGEYGEATRRGAEGTAWGASMFPALSRFANIGLGKQFTHGAGAAFADPESGAFEKAAAGVGGALGAGMLGKEALSVGKAFAKGGLKTGGKALAKSTGLGALVAAPFAISRAAEGDVAGAALEVAGAIPGAALVTEPILAYRDVQREQEKQKAQQEKQQQFMQQRYEKFMSTHKDLEKTEGKGVPEFMKYGEEELRAQEAAEKRKQKEQTTPKFVYENVIREGLKARGY